MNENEKEFLENIEEGINTLELVVRDIKKKDKITKSDIDILSKAGSNILFEVRWFHLTN